MLGRFAFFICAAIAFLGILRHGHSGHYEVFEFAARELWAGRNPYGREFPSGWWFYSPLCGLLVYGPFSLLPHLPGVLTFEVFSLAVFIWGLERSLRRFAPTAWKRELLYLLVASEVLGNILNTRLELLTLGLFLGTLPLALEPRRAWIFDVTLALLCNWKLQFLPIAGLHYLGLTWETRQLRPGLRFAGALALSFALPGLFLPLGELHAAWSESLRHFTQGNWTNFANLWTFVFRATGWDPKSWSVDPNPLLLAAGLLFAAFHVFRLGSRRISARAPDGLLQAAALGALFTSVLSPLAQSAAYVLTTPLLLAWLRSLPVDFAEARRQGVVREALLYWGFTSFLSSDLAPKALRDYARVRAWKALGAPLLALRWLTTSRNDR